MSLQKYVNDQAARCRTEWFKDHKATILAGPPLEDAPVLIINWQKPNSWNYGCRFIIHRRWLIVVGDIGEAVYGWGQDLTLDFLAQINFDYFHGKCQASPEGRRFNQWDGHLCIPALKDFLYADPDEPHREAKEILEDAEGLTSSEREWTDFLYQGEYKLEDDDYSLADAGEVPSVHAIGMFVGLQMALEQLKEKKA